jgi:uncharacterized protein YjbI with pentapeptide repeats
MWVVRKRPLAFPIPSLTGANLINANLTGADLRVANLNNAALTDDGSDRE